MMKFLLNDSDLGKFSSESGEIPSVLHMDNLQSSRNGWDHRHFLRMLAHCDESVRNLVLIPAPELNHHVSYFFINNTILFILSINSSEISINHFILISIF